ncbi:MAG: DNA replication/repair protein RecF [Opitutaceae bacterium]
MRLRQISLRHFRNIAEASVDFTGRQTFLLGPNAQGKTNLLEAVGFLTALRSFRTSDARLLVSRGQAAASLAFGLEHERQGATRVRIILRPEGRELQCDGERITRLADYLGRFPTVVFSAQDLQLLRGAPTLRRRWLDLTLASMDGGYLAALQGFVRAVASRNALLKSGRAAAAELEAFEAALAPAAADLVRRRVAGVAALAVPFGMAYAQLGAGGETAELIYRPDWAETDPAGWRRRLAEGRARDLAFRATLTGPHRDDVEVRIGGGVARDFASEGQQRSSVLALRLAQAAWFRERSGVAPIILADDVLGELDPGRRARFWSALPEEGQVIATGTQLPGVGTGGDGVPWQVLRVCAGGFTAGEGTG